jgi:hypothetical protein
MKLPNPTVGDSPFGLLSCKRGDARLNNDGLRSRAGGESQRVIQSSAFRLLFSATPRAEGLPKHLNVAFVLRVSSML